jgi:hypothetical protein
LCDFSASISRAELSSRAWVTRCPCLGLFHRGECPEGDRRGRSSGMGGLARRTRCRHEVLAVLRTLRSVLRFRGPERDANERRLTTAALVADRRAIACPLSPGGSSTTSTAAATTSSHCAEQLRTAQPDRILCLAYRDPWGTSICPPPSRAASRRRGRWPKADHLRRRVRRGSDIAKAVALDASVCMARPRTHMASRQQTSVASTEFSTGSRPTCAGTMALIGMSRLGGLNPELVRPTR